MKTKRIFVLGLISVIALISTSFYSPTDKYFEIARNLDIFASLFKEVNAFYVDEIDPEKSIRIGIDAMLASLDPYTNFIPEEDYDDYLTMTTGEYGGIGALIGSIDDKVVITMPNEGFPADKAGIKIGDELIEVNGVKTTNKNTMEVSALLKGESGTEINLKVKRNGELLEFNLVRTTIIIDNVPYAGMLGQDIGYINLSEFTTRAASEVETALKRLKKEGATKIILDVRGNPGGIVQEAVDICNLFIPKNKTVVETKGKTPNWNKIYKTTNKPVDIDIPLVVLASRSSASAAEIVSGTLQDYDRAVLVGQKTFGKGLVQTTRPLGYNSQVKITVAKYYTPSGRCIQAIDYAHRNEDGSVGKIADSLKVAFKTANGRVVYDGGGITPDIELEPQYLSPISYSLLTEGYVFNYANKYFYSHEDKPSIISFNLSEKEYEDFVAWLHDKNLDYQNDLEQAVDDFEEAAKEARAFDNLKPEIEALRAEIAHNTAQDLKTFKAEIKSLLEEQIVARYYLSKGEMANAITHDSEVAKAVEILNDSSTYRQLLVANQ